MKRVIFVLGLTFAGCSADAGAPDIGTEAPPFGSQGEERAPDAVPFYVMEARGHVFEFVRFGAAGLVIAERAAIGETFLLDGAGTAQKSLADVYRQLAPGTEVPRELLDYDAEVKEILPPEDGLPEHNVAPPAGSPRRAEVTQPGQRPLHEAGGPHFQAEHCPTTPDWATHFDYYEEHSPIPTRLFCWAPGFNGTWLESTTGKAMTHDIASAFRTVRYEARIQDLSGGWDVLEGQQIRINGHTGTYFDCAFPWIGACGDEDLLFRSMSGKVFDGPSGPTVWRFGGGFWQ